MEEHKFCDGVLENIIIKEPHTEQDKLSDSINNFWNVGDEIEAKDFMKKWYRARIMAKNKKHGGRLLVHFQGWSTKYDEWLSVDSDRIRPINSLKNESNKKTNCVEVGALVYAPWRDGRIYPGKIIQSTKQSCFVRFYDGMCRKLKNKFILNMTEKEQSDYLKEGYFSSSIFSIPSKSDSKETIAKLDTSNSGSKLMLNIKISKLLIKKSKLGLSDDSRGKHKWKKLKLSPNFLKNKLINRDDSNVQDVDSENIIKKEKLDLSINSVASNSSKKRRMNLDKTTSYLLKKGDISKKSRPKARCSFCQKNHAKFVTRPSLNALKQCYICMDCMQEYDERLRAHHLQAINEWMLTGRMPYFQMEPHEAKGKRKDDITTKSSDEVIMKTTNDVVAELTTIQKALSYIDQAMLLLKNEKDTDALFNSLLRTTSQKEAINSNNYTQHVSTDNSLLSNQSSPTSSFHFPVSTASHSIAYTSQLSSPSNSPSSSQNTASIMSSSSNCKTSSERHLGQVKKIKRELARMQKEFARRILSIESTVGVLEVGIDHNGKVGLGREQFQKTLDDLNDLALITTII